MKYVLGRLVMLAVSILLIAVGITLYIEANIMPWNLASRRAAEKAGYEEEGLSRHYLKINGQWEDHLHLVRLNEEDMDGRT